MDTLYQLLEWNPVQVGSTFQGGLGGAAQDLGLEEGGSEGSGGSAQDLGLEEGGLGGGLLRTWVWRRVVWGGVSCSGPGSGGGWVCSVCSGPGSGGGWSGG